MSARRLIFCGTDSRDVLVFARQPVDDTYAQLPTVRASDNPQPQAFGKKGAASEWLVVHGRHLHVCMCYLSYRQGELVTYEIDHASSDAPLRHVATTKTGGMQPCHAVARGRWLFVAHFLSGHVSVFDVADGPPRGGAPVSTVRLPFLRSSPPPPPDVIEPFEMPKMTEQRPFAHCVTLSPDGRWAIAVDAQQGALFALRFDDARGELAPDAVTTRFDAPPTVGGPLQRLFARKMGARPRHAAFVQPASGAPVAAVLAVVTEMACQVTLHAFDAENGRVSPAHATVPTFTPELGPRRAGCVGALLSSLFGAFGGAAELVLLPTGRGEGARLLATTRMFAKHPDSLRTFDITDPSPLPGLAPAQEIAVGVNPRHCTLTPDGAHLVLGQQGELAFFKAGPGAELELASIVPVRQGRGTIFCVAISDYVNAAT